MAAREGVGEFLSKSGREKLKAEYLGLKMSPKNDNTSITSDANEDAFASLKEEPCRICGIDSDHAKLLICDNCDGHFHTYCLDPPLTEIPEHDWFCAVCNPDAGDGLEELVSALPPHIRSRFGEICWAQGGVGYGWWPCCIYDPRLTVGVTRAQARKQIGKKYLVYFLQCEETPFDLLPEKKILSWVEGMAEDYYMGKTAKAAGRHRFARFLQAMQAACIEESKPVELRLDFNRVSPGQQTQVSPLSPVRTRQRNGKISNKRSRQEREDSIGSNEERKEPRRGIHNENETNTSFPLHSLIHENASHSTLSPVSSNQAAFEHLSSSNMEVARRPIDVHLNTPNKVEECGSHADKGIELFCRVYRLSNAEPAGVCVGFVELSSRESSTFVEARMKIEEVIEPQHLFEDWRFHHPKLGPVSLRLEEKTGPMLAYLNKGSRGPDVSDGTIDDPIRVTIIAAPDPLSHKSKVKG